jgi:hypothetical protein
MLKLIQYILKIIIQTMSILWSKIKTVEFERDQHDKVSEEEKKIRDAIDRIKEELPPDVKNGDVKGRSDNDTFNNKDWNKE